RHLGLRVGLHHLVSYFYSTLAFLDEFHRHVAQLGIGPASSQQRPPIVKIDLHRPPHGDPSGNRKALPHDGSPSARLMTQQHLAYEKTCRQEQEPYKETRAALS